jgi:2-keto-4-pentenoate hydratase/2-oxohepta-3-ene-1,7-dioic acid hydratase in catechol pathway
MDMAVWCTIRTYNAHAKELGNEIPSEAIFFTKPENCIHTGDKIPLSTMPDDVHYETECVLKLDGTGGVSHLMIGLDLTDRSQQGLLKAEKLPWARAKCFRASALLGSEYKCNVSLDELHLEEHNIGLRLTINDEIVQQDFLKNMSIPPKAQVEALNEWAPIQEGDCLFTGTPKGVGPLALGDIVKAELFWKDGEVISSYIATCV